MRRFDQQVADLDGRSILVTGGTGTFGRAFVRRVLDRFKPKRLVVFSRDEMKQYQMALDIPPEAHPALRYFIGDVRDADRLEYAMRGIDYVVHAAALKHVPTAEYNPFECIHTNVFGAENVVKAAIRAGVGRVVALSTDKAANPINLYGASKLASDKIFIAANHLSGADGPRFSVVRYGNVMASRGSVVPLFLHLIENGADSLPITDPAMTRFLITIEQGVQFVLSSLAVMRGGEIFVPRIPSARVTDIARAVAPWLEHRVIGIRPGEKVHEVMVAEDDAANTRALPDRYVILPSIHLWSAEGPAPDGEPVQAGFRYASDNNSEWLDADGVRQMILDCGLALPEAPAGTGGE